MPPGGTTPEPAAIATATAPASQAISAEPSPTTAAATALVSTPTAAPTAVAAAATAAPTVVAAVATPAPPRRTIVGRVMATVETEPVPNDGDAADDPAIWVHPTDPSLSLIIGTDKKGGLAVYDLTGRQLQYLPDSKMNNVDIRHGFPLGGQRVALVTASDRVDKRVYIYRVDPATRQLEDVAARPIVTGGGYGACMYRSAKTGKFYYIVNSERGIVEQWELFDNSSGKVDATKVREFDVGSQTEGCVADDELGHLYVGEEAVGIWKYGAEPDAGAARTQVDTTRSGGHLKRDLEGLTIYYGSDGTGYLIASSQGNNTYAVYRREGDNAYIASFEIVKGNGIDAVSETDGIDVTAASLGPAFPQGLFVAQDGRNDDDANQNYKLVPWQAIADVIAEASVAAEP
jgi:3-phytase